ncbi:hypothetical protein PHJA_000124900 [Phtheirospermum japonicum]|uniref:Bromo domain-containing protein n=1 Tax=Phtheirospermum japonicum TaxID=374723 RepID=A0A830B6T5_9LAMI|nr:hypothetical protein PHJA_000124900 [Phtheirospermum japonicum]
MTKPDGVAPEAKDDDVSPSWGTWEELILAFAVNRHGTASWDSIASELQKRTSDPNLSLTAHNCRSKYLDLKRRFVAAPNDDVGGGKSSAEESAAPLLEELRKLRVAELRREVQRYDLNIESLELRVKSLEEEREGSSRREKSESDLENRSEEEKRDAEPEAEPASGGEPVVGDEMEKDQLSVNESNSTDPGAEKLITSEKEPEPAGTGAEEVRQDRTGKTIEEPAELKPEPDRKSLRADSCNGSSNSIEKSDRKAKDEPVTDSADLVESEAESDGGGEAAKENSDVQSTASRSRKEEGSDKVRRGNTSGDEREHEDQSRAVKELSAESQPLFDFLQAIRAHKFGSTFERRLRSQETSKYHKLILQHMDLETVETRLREGWYAGSRIKFFRDLLLLINNALVFFGKKSAEANAANELRLLISKEISNKKAKSDSSSGKQASLQSLSMSKKDEAEPSNSLMLKPRISGSLIVCRKRSSIAAKASTPSSDKKKEQTSSPADEKNSRKQSVDANEPKITKKRTRDNRFSSSAPANTKKNGKNNNNNQANNNNTKQQQQQQQQQGKGGGSSSEPPKSENKKSQTGSDSKKRGAASFLNRMKQGSSSSNNNNNNNNGVLLDALKNTPLTNEGSAGKGLSEQKKNENVKRGEKKEQVTRRSTAETRQTKEKEKEKGSPGKKNVGRPPKRGLRHRRCRRRRSVNGGGRKVRRRRRPGNSSRRKERGSYREFVVGIIGILYLVLLYRFGFGFGFLSYFLFLLIF